MSDHQAVPVFPASPAEVFRQIAELHADQLKAGLLASFGPRLLEQLYRCAAADPDVILLAHVRDGKVTGFVMGSIHPSRFNRRLLIRLFPMIAWQILCRPSMVPRALSLARYIGFRPAGPTAELLSIAVDPQLRASGIGEALLREFHFRLRKHDVLEYRVTAADTQTAALQFYRKHGGVVVSEIDLGSLRAFTFIMSSA
jgi:ribosomal protein S18 acetylase RimI-like enzyme